MSTNNGWKPVDFHCHLDLFPNHVEAFRQSIKDDVKILSVTTTPRAWPENQRLAKMGKLIKIGLGLHPQIIETNWKEITLWEEYFPKARYIGEIGLDSGPRYRKSLELQKSVFEKILRRCAETGGKILSVHSTGCAGIVLDMIEKLIPINRSRIILHWFTGTIKEAQRANDLGCFFSINGAMLRNSKQKEVVKNIPIERIITETDAPFSRDSVNQTWPRDVRKTVSELGTLLNMDTNEIGIRIERNLSILEESI